MSKPLSDYNARDWFRLRPILHRIKEYRYHAIDSAHSRKSPRSGNLASVREQIRGRNALVTIAYGDAEAIRWQAALVREFVPNVIHIIADNTPGEHSAGLVASAANETDLPYLWLPGIAWKRGTTSRSHGLALNWVWRNLILPGKPTAFGFLDHDLFPIRFSDPFAELASQPFYGHVRWSGERWFLWAGFCMYRFSHVQSLPLDFGQDWFLGLDTGGGNWSVLYSPLETSHLKRASYSEFFYAADVTAKEAEMHLIDSSWLHEVGVRENALLRVEKRKALAAMLEKPLQEAAVRAAARSHQQQTED